MKVTVSGINETVAAIRNIPSSLDTRLVFGEVAEVFSDRLRAATPVGFSGRLKQSVLWEADDEEGLVGYDEGVESAGNPRLDSVLRPQTNGRSVLRWVPPDELEEVMAVAFNAYAAEGVTHMESSFAEMVDGIS